MYQNIYILPSSISVDVSAFLDVAMLIDATIVFVIVDIIFLSGDIFILPTPPIDSSALFTVKLGSNIYVGISSVHVNLAISDIVFLF